MHQRQEFPRLTVEKFRRFLGVMRIQPGLVSMQTALKAEGSENRQLREVAFQYPMHSARYYWEFRDMAGVGRRAILTAHESACRLSEAALMTGYEDVKGMVYAVGNLALLRLGSGTAPNIQAMDNRVPAILENFHDLMAAEDLSLRLELATSPTV